MPYQTKCVFRGFLMFNWPNSLCQTLLSTFTLYIYIYIVQFSSCEEHQFSCKLCYNSRQFQRCIIVLSWLLMTYNYEIIIKFSRRSPSILFLTDNAFCFFIASIDGIDSTEAGIVSIFINLIEIQAEFQCYKFIYLFICSLFIVENN